MFILYNAGRRIGWKGGVKLTAAVLLLGALLFYALPRLLGALWLLPPPRENPRKNFKEPLRVEVCVGRSARLKNFEFFDIKGKGNAFLCGNKYLM